MYLSYEEMFIFAQQPLPFSCMFFLKASPVWVLTSSTVGS